MRSARSAALELIECSAPHLTIRWDHEPRNEIYRFCSAAASFALSSAQASANYAESRHQEQDLMTLFQVAASVAALQEAVVPLLSL